MQKVIYPTHLPAQADGWGRTAFTTGILVNLFSHEMNLAKILKMPFK